MRVRRSTTIDDRRNVWKVLASHAHIGGYILRVAVKYNGCDFFLAIWKHYFTPHFTTTCSGTASVVTTSVNRILKLGYGHKAIGLMCTGSLSSTPRRLPSATQVNLTPQIKTDLKAKNEPSPLETIRHLQESRVKSQDGVSGPGEFYSTSTSLYEATTSESKQNGQHSKTDRECSKLLAAWFEVIMA